MSQKVRTSHPPHPSRTKKAKLDGPAKTTGSASAPARKTHAKPNGHVEAPQKPPPLTMSGAPKDERPAVARTLFTTASQMAGPGEDATELSVDALKTFNASPQMSAVLRNAMPLLQLAQSGQTRNLAELLGPLASDPAVRKAILDAAGQTAGQSGKRLVAAAMRGFNTGGLAGSTAEISKVAAKLAGTTGGTVSKTLGKAMPVIGNAVNLALVGSSAATLLALFRSEDATKGDKVAHVAHLACTVAGCFVPLIGVGGEVALQAYKAQRTA